MVISKMRLTMKILSLAAGDRGGLWARDVRLTSFQTTPEQSDNYKCKMVTVMKIMTKTKVGTDSTAHSCSCL